MYIPNRGRYSLSEYISKAPGYVSKSIRRWGIRRYRSLYFSLYTDHPSFDRSRAVESVARAESVLFLCWGNVCRSPLAERYFRRRIADSGLVDIKVQSAGLGGTEGRGSPDEAVGAGSEYGVDLSDHTSKQVSTRQIRGADVVFVMDLNNYHSVVRRFPDIKGDIFFLGSMLPRWDERIVPDPYGGDSSEFVETYRVIADAIDELVEEVDERTR